MTAKAISAIPPRVGRKLEFPEKRLAVFVAGTLARIGAVLQPDETRTDFIRQAVEREIKRRERAKPKGSADT